MDIRAIRRDTTRYYAVLRDLDGIRINTEEEATRRDDAIESELFSVRERERH